MRAPVIPGDGYELRALEPSDAAAWKAGEDPEQMRWFEAPGPSPMENVIAAIHRWQAGWDDDGPVWQWGIWVEGQLAGGVELSARKDGTANASYVVFPHARGRGLAAGALRLATRWGLTHLCVPAVVAVIDEQNEASRRVAVRAGFTPDGPAEPWECSGTGAMLRYVARRPETVGGPASPVGDDRSCSRPGER